MRLTCEARIARPPGAVFDMLLEVERVAGCVPGGRLTGRAGGADGAGAAGGDGSARYAGEATVDVGPLRTAYAGSVRYLEVDREARAVVLRASGRERGGQGDADAHIVARVLPDGAGAAPPARSVLSVDVDLLVRGRVAQLGRGVVGELGRRLIAEFAENLEHLLAEHPAPAAGQDTTARTGQPVPTAAIAVAGAVVVGAAAAAAAGALLRRWLRRCRRPAAASSGRQLRYAGNHDWLR